MNGPLNLDDRPASLWTHILCYAGEGDFRSYLKSPALGTDRHGEHTRVIASNGHTGIDAPLKHLQEASGVEDLPLEEADERMGLIQRLVQEGRAAESLIQMQTADLLGFLGDLETESLTDERPCPDCEGTGQELCPCCEQTTYEMCLNCGGEGSLGGKVIGTKFEAAHAINPPLVRLGEEDYHACFKADYLMLMAWTFEAAGVERFMGSTTENDAWVFYPAHDDAPEWQGFEDDWNVLLMPVQTNAMHEHIPTVPNEIATQAKAAA